ncbi:MAG: hypothetical protein JTT14_01305, partial [Candidatus Brockarchaeota archaeon]|nr:hypothetical protein [Candidatus Brockarchaeota archaeon]
YQWNDINYVPLLYRRCEKEIYGDTGVRRPKINLSSLDSIFEQDNILNQATIQDISISINPGSEEFYNKEIKSIDIKYEIGDEEIYFQIPVGVYTTFSGFMEYLFNAAYLSNDVSDDTLAKMYIILNIINQVKQKGDSNRLQALLSGDKLAEHTKKILQELQTTKTGKRIIDKALYKYLSLAGGYFYGKKGQQERVLVDVHDEGAPETIIPFLFSKPVQDLGRKTSRAFLDILGKVPDVFRNILSIPSAIRLLYTPPNSEYSGVLGFTINKPFLFSSRNTFLHRVANTDDRTSPITLVAGESSNIGLFSDVLRASGERFFDYDLFMYGGKSDPQNIYTNEENGGLIKDLSDEKLRYSSYHENKSPMATALHEIGHTIYYELPFHSKKRMFELYRRKYIGELDTTLQKFYDKLPDSTKSLVENSLMNAKLIASEIMTLNVTEKEFENLLYELKNALMFTSDTVYSHLSRDSTLQDEFNQFTTELREKYMAPYALTTFYELSSVAFDAYMYNREEFVRKFPEEYKYVILPMLEYIYNNKGIDLTVDGAWGKKIQEADFQKILT